MPSSGWGFMFEVALRKESVDRNRRFILFLIFFIMSLSARRAWIEMPGADVGGAGQCWSLSARRAWIEIIHIYGGTQKMDGRSPQGERG